MGKHTQSIDIRALDRIKQHGPGWGFTPADFSDLGSRTAVATALKPPVSAGLFARLMEDGVKRLVEKYDLSIPKKGINTPNMGRNKIAESAQRYMNTSLADAL